MTDKTAWEGTLLGVQPRIRLTRSFDERTHSYLGYVLRVRGLLGEGTREARGPEPVAASPPFLGPPPTLEVYRERGHRRLAARTYATKCPTCIWGCEMAVEMIIDHWDPSKKRYRRETFCYGPKSCRLHSAGPTRARYRGDTACRGRKRTG